MLLPLLVVALLGPPAPKVVTRPTSYDGFVSIRFSSPARVHFRCAVDKASLRPCTSPYESTFAPGRHSFRVQAIDKRGRRSRFTSISFSVAAPAPSVAVGLEPVSLAFGGGSLWTADYGHGTATRIDPVTRRVVATIPVGGSPGGVAYGGGATWIGNFGDNYGISRIDPATNAVSRLQVGVEPVGLLVDGSMLWVADYSGFVERVDTGTGTVVARIAIGGNPEALALGFGLLWVSNYDGSVATVDPVANALVGGKIAGEADMDAVATGPDAVWAASLYGSSLFRIDPAARTTRRISLPGQASGVLVVNGSVWVSLYNLGQVVRVDPATGRIVRRVRVGGKPRDLAFDGTSIWVVNQSSSSVSSFQP